MRDLNEDQEQNVRLALRHLHWKCGQWAPLAKPKDLWKRTKEASGITREFFDSYFDGREQAMAIAVKRPKRYATPKSLKDVSGSLTPPQSFQYLAAETEV